MKEGVEITKINKKEELQKFHRNCIIKAAEQLFLEKGVEKTTMDDIAKEADYSKATLYVYFKNKDEIYNLIIFNSMNMLFERIKAALSSGKNAFEQYFGICNELSEYRDEYPLYFESVISEINMDLELEETPQVFRDIYDIGEKINQEIGAFLLETMEQGIIKNNLKINQIVFWFWASIAGIIRMAGQKEKYITTIMGMTKKEFLQDSFQMLLNSILTDEDKQNQ